MKIRRSQSIDEKEISQILKAELKAELLKKSFAVSFNRRGNFRSSRTTLVGESNTFGQDVIFVVGVLFAIMLISIIMALLIQ